MMTRCALLFIALLTFWSYSADAQSCSVTVSGTVNWSTATWSCVGGASAPTTSGQLFTGDISITINNGGKLVIDIPITIDGDVDITTGGSAEMEVPSGVTFDVNGDVDAADENNMTFTVDGTMQVSGVFEVKNSNAFGGSGIISGNSIIVKNNNGCSAGGCPDMYFTSCQDGNNNFCADNVNSTTLDLEIGVLRYQSDINALVWQVYEPLDLKRHEVQYSKNGYVWTHFMELRKYSEEVLSIVVSPEQVGYYRVVSEDHELESGISNIIFYNSEDPNQELGFGNTNSEIVSIEKNSSGYIVKNNDEAPVSIIFFSLSGTKLGQFDVPAQSQLPLFSISQQSPAIVSIQGTSINERTVIFP